MSTDIHDKIKSEVERRLAIARAATPGPWMAATHTGRKDGVSLVGATANRGTGRAVAVFADSNVYQRAADAEHAALHDPADAIRRYTHALAILDRHPLCSDDACAGGDCHRCAEFMPCDPITDLATSLGLETTDG